MVKGSAMMKVQCEHLRLQVSNRAEIESVYHEGASYEFIQGASGYSAVEDCLDRKLYGYGADEARSEVRASAGQITITRRFSPSGLTITDQFASDKDAISWRTRVETTQSTPRTAHVFTVLPILGQDRHVFVAHNDAPLAPEEFHRLRFIYGGEMFRWELEKAVSLPMATFYQPSADAGLTCAVPPGQPVPAILYSMCHDSPQVGFVMRFANLRLSSDHPVELETVLYPHGGNWQEGLAWYHERYRKYFTVKNPKVYDSEGAMLCSMLHSDEEVKQWRSQGFAWQEIHANVYPNYGLYSPETEEWDSYTDTHSALDLDLPRLASIDLMGWFGNGFDVLSLHPQEGRMSKNKIREYIRRLHDNGVAAFMYIEPVLCDKSLLPQFEPSAARNEDGTYCADGYYHGVSMNPDPDGVWGQHIIRQLEGILRDYPECDGVFLDGSGCRHYDFAHDDGVTMIHNKPCSMLGFPMARMAARIAEIVHSTGKVVWANGPSSLEVVEHIDGFLAEQSGWWMGIIQYHGIEKPMSLLCGDLPPTELAHYYKKCLLDGGQPDVCWHLGVDRVLPGDTKETRRCLPADGPEYRQLLRSFRPLLDEIKGRSWVLKADALRTPDGVDGRCFERRDGALVVVLVVDEPVERAEISVSAALLGERKKARIVTTENAERVPVEVMAQNGWVCVSIPAIRGAAVVTFAGLTA